MTAEMDNRDIDNPALDPELRKIDDLFVRSYYGKNLDTLWGAIFDPGFVFMDGADGRKVERAEFDRGCQSHQRLGRLGRRDRRVGRLRAGRPGAEAAHRLHFRFPPGPRSHAPADGDRLR